MAARTDRTTDPGLRAALLLARRGQAYFSRFLRDLSDRELDEPSLLDGWSRRHVVAHVGLNARALTRLTTWAATGAETPMYASAGQRAREIATSATLPAAALRHLSDHAAVHLNVEWRDLEPAMWAAEVVTAQGRRVPASETVWMRTREVWIHAIDLDAGGEFEDLPPALLDALLADVRRSWDRSRTGGHEVALVPTDRGEAPPEPEQDRPSRRSEVRGTAAALARWATGRGSRGVSAAGGGPAPAAARWL